MTYKQRPICKTCQFQEVKINKHTCYKVSPDSWNPLFLPFPFSLPLLSILGPVNHEVYHTSTSK